MDEEDTTLLHFAANSSSPEALNILLQYGTDMNVQNGEGVRAYVQFVVINSDNCSEEEN